MAASLSSLWLKSIKRLTRVPRAKGRQLVKNAITQTVSAFVKTALDAKKRAPTAPTTRRAPVTKVLPSSAVQTHHPDPALKLPGAQRGFLPAGATWQKAYFSSPETAPMGIPRRMAYWLYTPAHAASAAATGQAMPLVVVLHGCQQTATDIAAATRMNVWAERKGFAVLYPQQSASADRHRCWHWYKRGVQRGDGEVAIVAQMIAQVQKFHGFDCSRTYAAGLSAGAALATILALRYPALIAAVGLHSAPVFATSDSALSAYRTMQQGAPHAHSAVASQFLAEHEDFPGMPVMVIHGDGDTVVRRINAQELAQQFLLVNASKLGSAAPARRLHAGSGAGKRRRLGYQTDTWYVKRKPFVVNCMVTGLGHAWSGGDSVTGFTDPRGPNASLMLWNFFAQHQRTAAKNTTLTA